MARMIWDVSVSLDGFTAGPNVRPDAPMGDGGEALHHWLETQGPDAEVDRAAVDTINGNLGASIVGRRTFDLGLPLWGGTPWPGLPCFVITHRLRADLVADNGGTFSFCSLEDAAERARAAAGERNINILGAAVARALLRAGHVDELRLHTVPILLGGGTPLFRGEMIDLFPEGRPSVGSVIHQLFRLGPGQPAEPAVRHVLSDRSGDAQR